MKGLNEKCHFIGVGGIGMSGLARILLQNKKQVSGSDIASNPIIKTLLAEGVNVQIGHSASYIEPGMSVIYSTDIAEGNAEFKAAKELSCNLLHRSELLQKIMAEYQAFTVSGTHGKTTTSSILAWMLTVAGLSPTYSIGGVVRGLSSNANVGLGNYFVAESCESDQSFLNYHPFGGIVTNIDFDHLSNYASKDAQIQAFAKMMSQVASKEHLFWCGDDLNLAQINASGIKYGFNSNAMLRGSNFRQLGWKIVFDVSFEGKFYPSVEVALVGKHNALNALAVFGLALRLNVQEDLIREALSSFGGVLRRLERKGSIQDCDVYDDYGHHPTEIEATIKGLRAAIGNKHLIVVYQPHRYSRAKECIGLYKGAFHEVDALYITEIYAAGEKAIEGISQEGIIEEVKRDIGDLCQGIKRSEVAVKLSPMICKPCVLLTLGAGDIHKLYDEINCFV